MLDADLAGVYGVSTKALNQAVKRNAERFPEDFMFRLTAEELAEIRSQISSIRNQSQVVTGSLKTAGLRSQFVTSKSRGGRRYLPYAFTEHGAIMAANVLNSPRAVQCLCSSCGPSFECDHCWLTIGNWRSSLPSWRGNSVSDSTCTRLRS